MKQESTEKNALDGSDARKTAIKEVSEGEPKKESTEGQSKKELTKNPKESDKSLKFRKIAGKRVNNTINEIKKLSKCSNVRTYEYSQRDVFNMFRSISKELYRARAKYEEALENKEGKNKFKF